MSNRTLEDWRTLAAQIRPRDQLWIDGRFVPAASGVTTATVDPATGTTLAKVAEADANKDNPPADKSVVQKTLGLELSSMSDDLRKKFKIKDGIKGVVVTGVDESVATADPDKRMAPGDVIVEVQYQSIATPADMQKRIDQLKSQGKKMAVLLVSNANGETRFVALSLQ